MKGEFALLVSIFLLAGGLRGVGDSKGPKESVFRNTDACPHFTMSEFPFANEYNARAAKRQEKVYSNIHEFYDNHIPVFLDMMRYWVPKKSHLEAEKAAVEAGNQPLKKASKDLINFSSSVRFDCEWEYFSSMGKKISKQTNKEKTDDGKSNKERVVFHAQFRSEGNFRPFSLVLTHTCEAFRMNDKLGNVQRFSSVSIDVKLLLQNSSLLFLDTGFFNSRLSKFLSDHTFKVLRELYELCTGEQVGLKSGIFFTKQANKIKICKPVETTSSEEISSESASVRNSFVCVFSRKA